MKWTCLSRLFPQRKRRKPEAALNLAEAYQQVFAGNATYDAAQVVLADLADFTGFYAVSNDPKHMAFNEGKRAVFHRIFRSLHMTAEEKHALAEAARIETVTSQYEGEI